ncbi:MAG: ABC transporter substrate-binding protein, partial [Pseudomonadota bacterium]
MRLFACVAASSLLLAADLSRAETINIGVLKFGTVNWLMETIQANRFDDAAGYTLEVVPLAGKAATSIAFQSGAVDLIVTDWVWAMHQRGKGADYRFFPYSNALGAVVAGQSEDLSSICDLAGRAVGVVGGPLDKSWLVLQSLATQECGTNLAEETQTLYGAPPLMSQQLDAGGIDAVVTYWHYAARLTAGEYDEIISVDDALERMGIVPAPALVGFVWDRDRIEPDAIDRFRASVMSASDLLATDDTAWERLRGLMKAGSDAEFEALRESYRKGISLDWTSDDTAAAART